MTGELIKRLAADVPINYFIERISEHPELWAENTWRQDYVVQDERPISPQKDTEAMMFRWAPENTIESVRDSLNVVPTKNCELFPEIELILKALMTCAEGIEMGRAFIAKLKPAGKVIPHMDYGMYADHFERFHLVLTSDVGNGFSVQDKNGYYESCYMRPGEFYWFSHRDIHWSENRSKTSRMHLIVDMVSPKYRRERGV